MTLLFFLRSPAGNTDTGQAPGGGGVYRDYDDADRRRKKRDRKLERQEAKLKLIAKQKWDKAFNDAADKEKRRRKKRKDEELLMLLFMHEFDGYDD